MKRTVFTTAVLSVGILAVTACSPTGGGQSDEIVVSYNTPQEWANWGNILAAFSDETGIDAPNDPKNSGQALAALEAEAGAPAADVAYLGIVFGDQAKKKELFTSYEPQYLDEVPDDLKDPDGTWFTVHQGAVAMLVNTEELGGAPVPKCWSDLTDPAYAGKVGYLDPTQAAVGYSVLTAVNLALGGSFEDTTPGTTWAKQMKANGVVNPVQTATAAVQQGEIPILIDADFNGFQLAADGAPIEVVYPCEGSLSVPYVMGLVNGAPHEDAGKQLLDYVLSDEAQAMFASSYLRPVRDDVEIPAEVEKVFLPADEYEELVTVPDFQAMQAAQEQFLADYTAAISQ